MHGLRTSGAFPGWTRLCDEWVIGLDRFTRRLARPFDAERDAVTSIADAVERVRRFARGTPVDPVAPDADGLLRFELQGYDYTCAVRSAVLAEGADLSSATRLLAEAVAFAGTRTAGEEVAAAIVVVTVPGPASAAKDLVDAALAAPGNSAVAWAVPEAGDPLASGEPGSRPALLLLARVAMPGTPHEGPLVSH